MFFYQFKNQKTCEQMNAQNLLYLWQNRCLKNAKFARFFETIKWVGCRLKMQIKRAVVT